MSDLQEAAQGLGLKLQALDAAAEHDFDAVFASWWSCKPAAS